VSRDSYVSCRASYVSCVCRRVCRECVCVVSVACVVSLVRVS
jgi:hypothetical protein